MSHDLAAMKLDISGLISEWGVRCIVSRLSGTTTASKRFSGSYVNVLSGTLWIQPINERDSGAFSSRDQADLIAQGIHYVFTQKSLALKAEDRILPSGDSYYYDVQEISENPTHNTVQVKRVKQS